MSLCRHPHLSWWVFLVLCLPPNSRSAEEPKVDEKMVRLQVWLDRQNFGPGKIDGKGGEFTSKARALYKEIHPGVEEDGPPEDFKEPTFTEHVVGDEAWKHVGTIPPTREEQSLMKAFPYPAMADLIAERYHTDIALLAALNPGRDLATVATGDRIMVPNVIPFEVETLRRVERREDSAKPGPRSVEISTEERILRVLETGKVIATFPLTAGSDRLPAPRGQWVMESIVTLPFFRWDERMLKEGKRGDDAIKLPPGPRNPVGVMWMGLNKEGIGIHGTDTPATIGRSVSHGCIRLANWDAVKLAAMLQPGTSVEIR